MNPKRDQMILAKALAVEIAVVAADKGEVADRAEVVGNTAGEVKVIGILLRVKPVNARETMAIKVMVTAVAAAAAVVEVVVEVVVTEVARGREQVENHQIPERIAFP
jgi:hypothetical protein